MAFYDNLGKRIQQTGQGAIDKTRKSAEVVRLNGTVSGLEREIAAQYTEIGRIYYQKHAGDEQDPDMVPYFQSINDKMQEIAECQDRIRVLKGYRKCVNCGNDISGTAVFCNYCGARQAPAYTAPATGSVCKKCGAPIEEGQVFCTECGARVETLESNHEPDPNDASEEISEQQDVASRSEAELKWETISESKSVIYETEREETPEVPEEEPRVCANCGEPLDEGALFCTNCGHKVDE